MRQVSRAPNEGQPSPARPMRPGLWAVPSSDPIADAVREAICAGRIPAGTKLGEEELSRIFGVSRTLVRQALQRLSFASLVTLRQNRGACVASPTLEEAEAVYAARRLVESEIIAEATRHCTANDIRRLRAHCRAQAAAAAGPDRSRFIELLGEFHLVIAEIGGNPVLGDFLTQLLHRTSLMQALYEMQEVPSCAIADHRALVDLMVRGDPKAAAQAMRRHLATNLGRLRVRRPPAAGVDLAAALGITPRDPA
jgi:DNA-binding GntR family transcriptional regulator